jgi:DNA-binding GntR family transcriptional regulator
VKLRDQAYDAVTQQLVSRRLLPGQFISQRELAVATSMSLGAIREMLPRLEAEGLIKPISQRGLQILRIDPKLIEDSFALRRLVEREAVAAFTRDATDHTIAEQRRRLDAIVAQSAISIDPALLAEAQAADWALHDAFVDHLDNRIVTELHQVNAIRIRMILGERIGLSAYRLPVALAEHAAILACIERRDVTAAVAALDRHLASSRRRALDPAGPDRLPDLS